MRAAASDWVIVEGEALVTVGDEEIMRRAERRRNDSRQDEA